MKILSSLKVIIAVLVFCVAHTYAHGATGQFPHSLSPASVAMQVPKAAPRMTILGHEAILIENAKNLNKTHTNMRHKWRQMREKSDADIFKTNQIPLPQHSRSQWKELSKRMPQADAMKKLRFINGFFNNIPSDSDIDVYGEKEYWATPREFLENRLGDCEDYAITKYFALQYFGWPPKDLWIILLHDKINDGMHAVLAARHKGNIFILDNLSKPATLLIPEKQYSKQVQPYLLLNYEGVWFFPSSVKKG